jgi:hypothetical protein
MPPVIIYALIGLILFLGAVLITRWAFRINAIVCLLTDIDNKVEELLKNNP